jgi:hypothetical protein
LCTKHLMIPALNNTPMSGEATYHVSGLLGAVESLWRLA